MVAGWRRLLNKAVLGRVACWTRDELITRVQGFPRLHWATMSPGLRSALQRMARCFYRFADHPRRDAL